MSFTISARGKSEHQPIQDFLRLFNVPIDQIDSVFGFAEQCKLYGGRPFGGTELSPADLEWMYSNNIGFRIPIQNTIATIKDYDECKPFLEKYHRAGNSLIIARDRFAIEIRKDFPLYKLEASVIRHCDSVAKVIKALELYDSVVPDPHWFNNTSDEIPIEYRDRIRLFANAGCMYTCPARICYGAISKMNLGVGEFRCSIMEGIPRTHEGMQDFDIIDYELRGYTKFKLLRHNLNSKTGY